MKILVPPTDLHIPPDFPRQGSFVADPGIGRLDWCGAQVKSNMDNFRSMRILGRFALVFLLHGEGWYEDVRNGRMAVGPGTCIVVLPDLAHVYGPSKDAVWEEVFVVFGGAVFDLWYAQGLLSAARPVLQVADPAAALAEFTGLMQAAAQPDPVAALATLCRFQGFLAALVAADAGATGQGAPSWLNAACRRLGESLGEHPDYRDLAQELGMSYESFRKKFAAHTGLPPDRYRNRLVMQRACDLLYRGGHSLKAIAAELGFCDEFHFSRRFKQAVGVPPSAYARADGRWAPGTARTDGHAAWRDDATDG